MEMTSCAIEVRAEAGQMRAVLARPVGDGKYPGAPHGFFCDQPSYQPDAARDAWQRLLRFFARHLQGEAVF
jgi:dienelactone hydrolase